MFYTNSYEIASDLVKSLVATGVRDGLNRRSSVGGSFVEPPLLPPEGPVALAPEVAPVVILTTTMSPTTSLLSTMATIGLHLRDLNFWYLISSYHLTLLHHPSHALGLEM